MTSTRYGLLISVGISLSAIGQVNAPSTVPGSPQGFNYPLSYEAVTADPKNHRVDYDDAHVRLLEVTVWPGDRENMHGHPRPSIFAIDGVQPKMDNRKLSTNPQEAPRFGKVTRNPGVVALPRCMAMAPESPHAALVTESFPQHFYRIEFKRMDGDAGLADHWKSWYPDAAASTPGAASATGAATAQVAPGAPSETSVAQGSAPGGAATVAAKAPDAPGAPALAVWPYPAALENVRAAPHNYRTLFADAHVRLLEVTVPPNTTTPLHDSPYYAIDAFDAPEPGSAGGPNIEIRYSDPHAPSIAGELLQRAASPEGWNFPTCKAVGPEAPREITNKGTVPIHFYRIEFFRVDGDDVRQQWQTWYPATAHRE